MYNTLIIKLAFLKTKSDCWYEKIDINFKQSEDLYKFMEVVCDRLESPSCVGAMSYNDGGAVKWEYLAY